MLKTVCYLWRRLWIMLTRTSTLTWQKWLLVVPLLLLPFTILFYTRDMTFTPAVMTPSSIPSLSHAEDFFVYTPGCRMPKMDPFDPNIRKYLKNVPKIRCSPVDSLVKSNQTALWVDVDVLAAMNASFSDVSCCYYPFWRKEVSKNTKTTKGKPDHKIVGEAKCYSFSDSIIVQHEYVKVMCNVTHKTVYKDFHAFIVPKKPKTVPDSIKKKPSVLVLGVDAVSRLNFYRQMPRTLGFLIHNNAIEFLGYNKIGDNTFPNVLPILTGNSMEELKKTCWPHDNAFFDDCPYVWKNFSDRGFLTAFGEDTPWMGLFLYLKRGFLQPPTDYYLQPFMKMNEDEIGHRKEGNAKLCYGPRLAPQVLLDYAGKFAINLTESSKPFFGWFWGTTLTHDFLNFSPDNDDIYVELLQNLQNENVLENTVVIVLSDHGLRWGSIRQTYQGRVEERYPFIYILLPSWFREQFSLAYSNMNRNRRLLTSPYDFHETLLDLMDLSEIEPERLVERMGQINHTRGISWFLPVPETRTCQSAGITDEWCLCHESKEVDVRQEKIRSASQAVVDQINQKLFQYIQCAQLSLNKVISARVERPKETVLSDAKKVFEDLVIVVETVPGNGLFEATVRYHQDSGKMEVLGYLSRINAYGNQSRCVLDFHLRLYCYCI